ncbi:DUF29 family protein [Paraburkholderia nemoris]|uniref:DUF29 family protein n=1 Tax=Paraburkholderia nemoris TaxID=2793076 RepID=UPI0038BBA81D
MQLTFCDEDVFAWAVEQARFLREGRFDLLDIEHIADEIEDVGKRSCASSSNRYPRSSFPCW